MSESSAPLSALTLTERTRAGGANLEYQRDLAYALTNPGAGGRAGQRLVCWQGRLRGYTPHECERLQGLPDDWTDGAATTRFQALGDAAPSVFFNWLGRRV